MITQPRLTNITIALDSSTVTVIAPTNSTADSGVAGNLSRQSPIPSTGTIKQANANIIKARGTARAIIHAIARAYQKKYVSSGRRRSYAILPLATICAISGSASHGSSARNACPSHT